MGGSSLDVQGDAKRERSRMASLFQKQIYWRCQNVHSERINGDHFLHNTPLNFVNISQFLSHVRMQSYDNAERDTVVVFLSVC